jgi:hypothetical protein
MGILTQEGWLEGWKVPELSLEWLCLDAQNLAGEVGGTEAAEPVSWCNLQLCLMICLGI